MEFLIAGHSLDLMRLISALLMLSQAAMAWLLVEPIMVRAVPALPLPRRSAAQRVLLCSILAVEVVIGFILLVALDLQGRSPF